jgi:hypothetical protein
MNGTKPELPEDLALPVPEITLRPSGEEVVAEVGGYEAFVDEAAEASKRAKQSESAWENFKRTGRASANHIRREFLPEQPLGVVRFRGKQRYLDVAFSSRRKALPAVVASRGGELVVEETTVTLRGALATWAIGLLGAPQEPDYTVERKLVLAKGFEGRRRERYKAADADERKLLDELEDAGIFAPAVEVKAGR